MQMSSVSRPRDVFFFGKRDRSRKGRSWSGGVRRPRVKAVTLVESLETRQMLSAVVASDPMVFARERTAVSTAPIPAVALPNCCSGEAVQRSIDGITCAPVSAVLATKDLTVGGGVCRIHPLPDRRGNWLLPV